MDEVLARNYLSRGGLEKLRGIKSMKWSGKMTLPLLGIEMPQVIWQKIPGKMRVESAFQNRMIVLGIDGETTWWTVPLPGTEEPQDMPAAQAELFREQADSGNRLTFFEDRGDRLELLGREEIDGIPVFKLKLTGRESGRGTFFYLDSESGLELKNSGTIEGGDGAQLVECRLRDYRPVDGVMFPFAVESRINGKVQMQLAFDSVEINPSVDDAIFRKPPGPGKPDKKTTGTK